MRDNKLVPSWLKYKSNFCEYILHENRPIFNELNRIYHFTCPMEVRAVDQGAISIGFLKQLRESYQRALGVRRACVEQGRIFFIRLV